MLRDYSKHSKLQQFTNNFNYLNYSLRPTLCFYASISVKCHDRKVQWSQQCEKNLVCNIFYRYFYLDSVTQIPSFSASPLIFLPPTRNIVYGYKWQKVQWSAQWDNLPLKVHWYSYVFSQGWIIKMLATGNTINIFRQTRISNLNIFFIKKRRIMWLLRAIFIISLLQKSWLTDLKEKIPHTGDKASLNRCG